MAGFYRSKYLVHGEPRWMATTQFESTDARRSFPCWDEPALKATFKISLIIPKDLSALSNMPVASQEPVQEGAKTLIRFEETPVMSTYLLAYIVGEFDYVEDHTQEGVKVRVYTPPGKSSQGAFALKMATRTLSFFTEYFGITYPLPKADMIAIADFASGAMENWGLITYRETALLIDEATSGVSSKQRVAYVVAHELAHQWFGNLVTMEWWKELWLNEGFATWVGNLAVAHFFPEWDIWTSFISDYFSRAQLLDAMINTHPVEVEVNNSDEIDEIFDVISYCKGASVIRMIATYLGEEDFKRGLNIYLNAHLYANATTDDLWAGLTESSGKDVKGYMDDWIKRAGLPVISVSQSVTNPRELVLRQERFLSSGASVPADQNTTWKCFIGVVTEKVNEPTFVELSSEQDTVTIPENLIDGPDSWVKVNAGQSGFFFVHYDDRMLENLTRAVQANQLNAQDRIGLISDAYALTKAGRMSTAQLLRLVQGYSKETDFTVFGEVAAVLGAIYHLWEDQPCSDALRAFCQEVFAPTGK